jgi:transcriptional regulator with XRE-family HTH domain
MPRPMDPLSKPCMEVAGLLKELRHRADKSCWDVARAIGATDATIVRYENGTQRISLENLCKLLVFYKVELSFVPPGRLKNAEIAAVSLEGAFKKAV